jgi:hypothetical protein
VGFCFARLMYSPIAAATDDSNHDHDGGGFSLLGPSPWWLRMKTTPDGRVVLRDMMRQMFVALAQVHGTMVVVNSGGGNPALLIGYATKFSPFDAHL